jgi:dihydrodipicolinate synthase/N-acetylneuraminate lyase
LHIERSLGSVEVSLDGEPTRSRRQKYAVHVSQPDTRMTKSMKIRKGSGNGMKYSAGGAKQWVRNELSGYLVTTTTPFTDDLLLDEEALRSNVRKLLEPDAIRGLYVGSIYQEPTALTIPERKRINRIVIEEANGAPVVAGASANNLSDAIEIAQAAQNDGADLVMVWPPLFGMRTNEGVYEFIKTVANSVDIGVCLYSTTLPEFGFQLKPATVSALGDLVNVVAVKEASFNIASFIEMITTVGDKVVVSCPLEEYWLYGRMLGLPGAAKFLLGSSRPLYMETGRRKVLSEFLAAVDVENWHEAGRLLTEILRVVGALHNAYLDKGGHNVAITKEVLDLMGLVGGAVRPPLSRPGADDIELAHQILLENGLLPLVKTTTS